MNDKGYEHLKDAEKALAPIWKDRNDLYHPINEISDSYLMNIIAFIERMIVNRSRSVSSAWASLGMVSGEMAEYSIEGSITSLEEEMDELVVMKDTLVEERDRRIHGGDDWDHYYVINDDMDLISWRY